MATAHARATLPMQAPSPEDRRFFGHPHGLSTLFFTEMWERFSYYGMRALLILFMTAAPAAGGLGFDTDTAGAVYGLYTSMVYMTSLPGGWIADRLIGQRRAVLYGGMLIASGHFSMAFPSVAINQGKAEFSVASPPVRRVWRLEGRGDRQARRAGLAMDDRAHRIHECDRKRDERQEHQRKRQP